LRLGRTAGLRVVSPIDAAFRLFTGEHELPPLWLRRHSGPITSFESSACGALDIVTRLQLVTEGDHILDLGCGPGAMAAPLGRLLGEDGRYVGVDVHRPSIQWCRGTFCDDPRYRFELAPGEDPGGRGRTVRKYRFPVPDASQDFILAKSLFTHLLEPQASHYLSEIRRVLRPGGRAMLTAFLFGQRDSAPPAFPFGGPESTTRWRIQARPQAAVAFDRAFFESLIVRAGLRLDWVEAAFWPGDAPQLRAQDILFIARPEKST
jgi:SAM-dependent methyltransferase